MTFKMGYAQDIITPTLERPVYLAGFGQDRRAKSVHDDLFAKALAISQGETLVVLVALDLIGLGRHLCQELERRIQEQVPGVRLLITCTHTHHGPDTIGLWGPDQTQSGVDPLYVDTLREKIVSVGVAACQRLEPADLRSISVDVTGVAKNARDPEILDEELTCLQFCRPVSGVPLVTWLIYPCHPEVLWDQNPHITADYIHSLRQEVELRTRAPCLVMVGSLGGMMTPDMGGNTFVETQKMGQILAEAALSALASRASHPVRHLAHSRQEYDVPMRNPLFHMAINAGLLPDLRHDDGLVTTEANLLRLDGTWLFSVPGELLPKLGLGYRSQMKKAGGRNTAVIGLTNDELGYILPAGDFIFPENPFEPDNHYEETMSVSSEAGPRLTAALLALLADVGAHSGAVRGSEI